MVFDLEAANAKLRVFHGERNANLAKDYSPLAQHAQEMMQTRFPEQVSYPAEIYRGTDVYWTPGVSKFPGFIKAPDKIKNPAPEYRRALGDLMVFYNDLTPEQRTLSPAPNTSISGGVGKPLPRLYQERQRGLLDPYERDIIHSHRGLLTNISQPQEDLAL